MTKSVLVAGGTGLIGTPLVKLLIEKGFDVTVAALDMPRQPIENAHYVVGDFLDLQFCKIACNNIDHVYNVAGPKGSSAFGKNNSASMYTNTILVNTNLLEASRLNNVSKYMFCSSMSVYPSNLFCDIGYLESSCSKDNGWGGPPTVLGHEYTMWAKRMGELQCYAYHEQYSMSIKIVRPTIVYGPLDNFKTGSSLVIPSLIKKCTEKQNPITVIGDGTQERDFLFSCDAAQLIYSIMGSGKDCDPINLGSGNLYSVSQVLDGILNIENFKPKISFDKNNLAGDKSKKLNLDKMRSIVPNFVSISLFDGLAETIRWYKNSVKY